MTALEFETIVSVINALQIPRDRLGRIQGAGQTAAEALREHAKRLKLPHGGADIPDQAAMVLQGLIGVPFDSVLGWK